MWNWAKGVTDVSVFVSEESEVFKSHRRPNHTSLPLVESLDRAPLQ